MHPMQSQINYYYAYRYGSLNTLASTLASTQVNYYAAPLPDTVKLDNTQPKVGLPNISAHKGILHNFFMPKPWLKPEANCRTPSKTLQCRPLYPRSAHTAAAEN